MSGRSHSSGAEERSSERAFVLQFDRIGDGRSRLRGRVEQVASGEAIHFRSLKQLVGFIVTALRKQTTIDRT